MRLLLAIGTAAVLTAACSASASVSGSSAGTAKTTGTVQVASGANAGSNVQGPSDVNRVNPLIGKAGSHPVQPSQAAPLAQAAAPAPGGIKDRCNGGIGNPPAAGNRAAPAAGKVPQLPACMPE